MKEEDREVKEEERVEQPKRIGLLVKEEDSVCVHMRCDFQQSRLLLCANHWSLIQRCVVLEMLLLHLYST